MAKHLITVGNGYVGSFLAEYLLNLNQDVTILDLFDDKDRDKRSNFIKADITDFQEINKAIKGMDYVHHSAALVPLKKSGELYKKVNILGTENVMKSCLENNIKHVVHISSSAIFGNVEKNDCPISTEPKNLKPIEIYGESKLNAEFVVKKFITESINNNHKTSFSIIRPRTIIGTKRLGIFQVLFEWVSEGRNIFIIGNGSNLFQFLHINDLCDAIYRSSQKKLNEVFNVGSKNFYTLSETLGHLCTISKTKSKVKSLPEKLVISLLQFLDKIGLSPLAPWHYLTYHKDYFFDISKTEKLLEWKPKYDDKKMIEESYNWYLENKNNLKETDSAHRSIIKQKILKIIKYFA